MRISDVEMDPMSVAYYFVVAYRSATFSFALRRSHATNPQTQPKPLACRLPPTSHGIAAPPIQTESSPALLGGHYGVTPVAKAPSGLSPTTCRTFVAVHNQDRPIALLKMAEQGRVKYSQNENQQHGMVIKYTVVAESNNVYWKQGRNWLQPRTGLI